MRNTLLILLSALCLLIVSCDSKTAKTVLPAFTIESSDVDFKAEGGTGVINIKTDKLISATCEQDWCNLSINGNEISFTIDENHSIESRAAFILITCDDENKTITVSQLGDVTECNISSKFCSNNGEEFSFELKTKQNVEFEIVPEEAKDWLQIVHDQSKSELKVIVSKFSGDESRTGTVSIGFAKNEWSADFKQQKPIDGNYILKYTRDIKDDAGEKKTINHQDTVKLELTESGDAYNMTFVKGFLKFPNSIKLSFDTEGRLQLVNRQILDEDEEENTIHFLDFLTKDLRFVDLDRIMVAYIVENSKDEKTSIYFTDPSQDKETASKFFAFAKYSKLTHIMLEAIATIAEPSLVQIVADEEPAP